MTTTLPTTSLGRTGLEVTRLGLGLAALGRPGYINLGHAADLAGSTSVEAMERNTHAVLDAARARGVRYLDAARSYGRAEDFLSSWLTARGIARGDLVVGSKWGYRYTAGWRADADVHEVKEHRLEVLEAQLAESRARLGEHLALYQIHSATLESGVLDDDGVLDRLARLAAEGVAVGLSLSGAAQADTLRRALEVRRDGVPLFRSVQATWNLLERSAGEALAEAHDAGLGVIVKEGLANGRLTTRNAEPGFSARAARLAAQAERLETTVDALALAGVLARPWVDVVLSGAATAPQLESNLAAAEVAWDAEAEVELADLAEAPEAYWSTRRALPWS